MPTRNPERTGGLGRPQYADRLARDRGTSSSGVTMGTQEPRLPRSGGRSPRSGKSRDDRYAKCGAEGRVGAVCDARIDPRGTAGRVVRILPSRHPGASTDPLRREDPAEREGGLYDLNVGIGAPWMRPRARESTRSKDGARPLTGPSRSGDRVNGSSGCCCRRERRAAADRRRPDG